MDADPPAPTPPAGAAPVAVKRGAPCQFDREAVLQTIIPELERGKPLSRICDDFPGMPVPSTVVDWMNDDETIARRIARARAIGEETILERTLGIAEESTHPLDRKVRIWAIHEFLKRFNPKRWGEQAGQQGAQVTVSVTNNVVTSEKLAEIRRRKRLSIERNRSKTLNRATPPALTDSDHSAPVIDVEVS